MIKKILVAASLLLSCLAPASAQFADQATYAGTGAGSANAQTITLANVSQYADLTGVLVKYVPGAGPNTGDTTLNINSLGSPPHFRRPGVAGGGMVTLTGNELVVGQPVWFMYDGTYFNILSVTSSSVGASNLSNSALQFGVPVNLQLNASVATNALTIAVKGNNGNDPSASNPVLIPFRDNTIANGDPKIVSLQSALSLTIASGSTMGCTSGNMCRLWMVAICSTGLECTNSAGSDVVGLCAFNALSVNNIATINEAVLQTSASGTSGGNSAQTYYCNISAVTSRSIRILGYVDIQEASAGTWATGPTYTQLFGPGIKRPGDVIATTYVSDATSFTSSSSSYAATALSATLTLQSAANLVSVNLGAAATFGGNGGNVTGGAQVNRVVSASPTAIGQPQTCGAAGAGTNVGYCSIAVNLNDVPHNTAPSYTLYINRSAGSAGYNYAGGTMTLFEIMGSLDDLQLTNMVG